jgi:hypothetical protein
MTLQESRAEIDFSNAHNRALVNKLQHFLRHKDTELLSFSAVKQMIRPGNEIYRGMQVIDVNNIVGSEGRYNDFDNHFFPKTLQLKNRWESIDMAHLSDVALPPIKLYELGGLYFVRDGNHRVSVFKSQGVEFVDAEVTSLESEIKLKHGTLTPKTLLKQVLRYEKRNFYAETNFGDITDCWDLDFSSPGQYDIVMEYIFSRKEYLTQCNVQSGNNETVSLIDATFSWYLMVYFPVIEVVRKEKILRNFKGRTVSDMFMYVTRHWDEMKQQFGSDIPIEEAAIDLKIRHNVSPLARLVKFFRKANFKHGKG